MSSDTDCRTGPSTSFDLIITLSPGVKAELVGKNTGLDYRIINIPGGSGQCWLWGQYAGVEGNVAGLPEFTAPPTPFPTFTPTPAVPAAPKDLTFTASCLSIPFSPPIFVGATLYWTDKANNEDGYHIYYSGGLIATLGPDTESYATVPSVGTYGVEAFNSSGASARKEVNVGCP